MHAGGLGELNERALLREIPQRVHVPNPTKYVTIRAFKGSILGTVTMVLGRYLISWELGPLG